MARVRELLLPKFEDPALEGSFRKVNLDSSIPLIRGALLVSVLIESAFTLTDVSLNGRDVWTRLLLLRFTVWIPLLLAPFAASYFTWGRRHLYKLLGAMVVVLYFGRGFTTFSLLPLPLRHDTLFAMLLIVVLPYFILKLPVRVLYLTGPGVALGHIALCLSVRLPAHMIFMHTFTVLLFSASCMFAALQLETSVRRNFAASEQLRLKSTELERALGALRSAQADLVRAERMASVATLVKGIAHELNNPIGYIAGNMAPLRRYCDFLVRVATDLSDGRPRSPGELEQLTRLAPEKDLKFVATDLARLTGDVGEGARRAKLIIGDLQSLTAASQRGVEQVDLGRAIGQTLALLQPRKGPGVSIVTDLSPVPLLTARAGQLEQVLVNLVDNALRAVGDQGTIRVGLTADGERVRLSVADDGPGMTPEVRRQALEPFFTTRAPGEGSGLGLAIVAAIVRGHRGTLTLKSQPGHGTEVVAELPLVSDLVDAAEVGMVAPPAR